MERYQNSIKWFEHAVQLIPTASQTFSKSYYSLPKGGAPLFLERGKGACVWDLDGNRYLDLINGLLCVSLGYGDEDVDRAITQQIKKGLSFSLPHRLEAQVAEQLQSLIPCAEMVRFGKNGSDATSAAVRLARAVTGRDHIAVCGYHGWQDWYIGSTTRNLGVPQEVQALTHGFAYNNIDSLKGLFAKHSLAAVIMEPMNSTYPEAGFLEDIRALCSAHGSLLIFDETITGFRFHQGGAQSLFGVIPDLATFGKGMANGMPLSAVVGSRELMSWMDKIFFSGTFGGETLSLAAANAVIKKIQDLPVLDHISQVGQRLATGVEAIINELGISWLKLGGHPSWKILQIDSGDVQRDLLYKTILLGEMAQAGVLTIGSHNVSYSLREEQVDEIVAAYRVALQTLVGAEQHGNLESLLRGELLQPVFKVR